MDGINGNMNYECFVASAVSTYGANKGSSSDDLSRSELKKIFDKYANSDGDASTLNPEEQDKAFAEMREYVSQLLLKYRGFPQKPPMGLVENRIYKDAENDSTKTVTVKDGVASVKSEYYNKKIDGFLIRFKFVSKGDEEGKDKFVPVLDSSSYKNYSRYKNMFNNLPKEVERNALNQYKNYNA